jgi:hypothetical protein
VDSRYIAVHLRRGDFVEYRSGDVVPIDSLAPFLRRTFLEGAAAQQQNEPYQALYVATDERDKKGRC